jgi:hypothetical protein
MKHKKQLVLGKRLLAFPGWRARIVSLKADLQASLFRSVFPRMKTSCFVVALLAFGILNIQAAQTTATSTGASQIAVPKPTAYRVIDAGANHRVWQNETYEKSPDGQVYTHIHTFKELCSGLNYLKAGQWVESKEQIEVLPQGGAAAVQGQHQAYFPGDIYNGFIELVTPDGQHLKSRPLGLSYDDGNNTVFIAVLTNSIGQLVGSNQVIYPDAFTGFTGFKVDLRYTYTKAGFEQDVILRAQPPTPESLGLNPATARLQVLTEFFSPPQPVIQARELAAQAGLSLTDQSLGFGAMQMVPGRAFLLGNNAVDSGAQVGKQWLLLDGRQFLVEEVPVDAIADGLATLPLTAMRSGSGKNSHMAFRHLALPPQRLVKNTSKTMMLAKAGLPAQGLVLDYQIINSSLTNYTFQGDTTYYISGNVNLNGTNNVFEGGAILKYTNNASVALQYAGVKWQGSAYRPVIFTAKDDNSVGEIIAGSTGNPSGYYANQALNFYQTTCPTMSYFRIAYAQHAIIATYSGTQNFYNGQLVNCQYGMDCESETINLRNMLFANVQNSLYNIFSTTLDVQNTTFSSSSSLASPLGYASLSLKNCILANVTTLTNSSINPFTFSGDHNGFYNSPAFGTSQITSTSYPFQTVGGGSYYLTNGCNFFNQGTTNIDAPLLASLRNKTTYPPLVYSNVTISAVTTFSPQAQRDTDIPDLGYHYDPLDYAFGGVRVYSNLTFTAGTAVGWFELPGSGGPGYGISIYDNVILSFNGTAASPCTLARYSTVQEGGNGLWKDKGWLAAIAAQSLSGGYGMNPINAAQVRPNFTRHAALAGDPNHYREYNALIKVAGQNSEFWNGYVGCYWVYLNFTNCLFDRTGVGVYGGAWAICGMRNCTMHGGNLTLQKFDQTWPVWIEECAFDGTTLSVDDNSLGNTNITYCDFNAFLSNSNRLPMLGTHDVTNLVSFNWQSSWLGNYYLPTNSPLINVGSTTADQFGLYHFTTQTNQVKETNSIVDIGYHYVAVDAYGNPIDTNGDGIPDYLEDANGNGLIDSGEIGWNIFGDLGLKVIITRPRSGSSLP